MIDKINFIYTVPCKYFPHNLKSSQRWDANLSNKIVRLTLRNTLKHLKTAAESATSAQHHFSFIFHTLIATWLFFSWCCMRWCLGDSGLFIQRYIIKTWWATRLHRHFMVRMKYCNIAGVANRFVFDWRLQFRHDWMSEYYCLNQVILLQLSCHEPLLILVKDAWLIVELLGFNEPLKLRR